MTAPTHPDPSEPTVHIRPGSGRILTNLVDVWRYRELLYFLVWRDVKVRYKQTLLGMAWAVLQPVLAMIVFSIFFGRLAKIPSNGIPYPLFSFSALLPWQLFAHALTESSNSLVASQNLITKVFFPRLVIPLAAALGGLVDFLVGLAVLFGLMVYYGKAPTLTVLALPLFVIFAIASAFAVSLWLSVWNVRYRDVRYTLPFLVQIWLFATPIAYPSSLVPSSWRGLYGLNPMAGVVEGFRRALLGDTDGGGPLLAVSVLVVLALLAGGIAYFVRSEGTFADVA